MAWLKAIDESAGSRDRQLESKPSTYCHMEVVDESEAGPDPEESPAMAAAVPTVPIAKIPALSLMNPSPIDGLREPLPLPENVAASMANCASASDALPPGLTLQPGVSPAMAAAAAACLVGAAPPPPLAWLLAQHGLNPTAAAAAAYAAQLASQHPTRAHVLPHGVPAGLPVAVASHKPPSPTSLPAVWTSETAIGAAIATQACSAFSALPPAAWTPDLLSLFSHGETAAKAQQLARTEHEVSMRIEEADPLCLTPELSAGLGAVCVSPFELEKRPKPFVASSSMTASTCGSLPVACAAPPPLPAACGLPSDGTDDLGELLNLTDDTLPMMKDAEYSAFIEALMAV